MSVAVGSLSSTTGNAALLHARGRLYALDALRGLAASMVAFDHFTRRIGLAVVPRAYIAVDFFFILSGLIVTRVYAGQIARDGLWPFLARRLIRLYPLFAVGLLLGAGDLAAAALLHQLGTRPFDALAVSLIPNAFVLPVPLEPGRLFPLNGPMWSMTIELGINIAFALWLMRLDDRALTGVAAVAGTAVALLAWRSGTLNLGWSGASFAGGVARGVFGFATGMLIARRVSDRRRLGAEAAAALCGALVLAMILVVPGRYGAAADLACGLLVMPLIVWSAALIDLSATARRAAGAAGDMAYPVYCLHFPLIAVVIGVAHRLRLTLPEESLLYAALLGGAAVGVLRWFDLPVRRWLKARLDARTASAL